MNVYDIDQTILSNNIKDLVNEAYHLKTIVELNKILNILDSNNSSNHNNNNENSINYSNLKNSIIKIISYIKSPYQLLNQDRDIQFSFLFSPSQDHPIFIPIIVLLEDLNRIIKKVNIKYMDSNNNNGNKLIIDKLNEIYDRYKILHHLFIKKLSEAARYSTTRSVNILKSPALLFTECLNEYQVKSLELSYDIISYNPVEYQFKKRNESGVCYGSVINNKIFFKVERYPSLRPIKEYAVYQLYKSLYPLSKSTIISPTQLVILDKLEVFEPDEPVRKELGRLRIKYNIISTKDILQKEPEFRIKLESSLQNCGKLLTQASLFINGVTLENYLRQCEINNDIKYSQIDLESFSSHILSTLLLNQTLYKADDLILQNGTNKIIGIDNDEVLESEFRNSNRGVFPNIKNILFTLKSLMSKSIHQNVKDQFIQHNPSLYILKWLISLKEKHSNYYSLISKVFELDTQIDEENKFNTIKKNLNLPLKFAKGWISLMLQRFKSIKQLLLQNANISHQELFNEIYPLTSIYYQLLSNVYSNPLDQIVVLSNREYSFNELLDFQDSSYLSKVEKSNIKNQVKEESKKNIFIPKQSVDKSIQEIIQGTEFNDLTKCKMNLNSSECINHNCENSNKTKSSIVEWLELVFLTEGSGDFNFHKSWYKERDIVLKLLLSHGSSVSIISNAIQVFDITIKSSKFISIINQNNIINNNNIQNQVEFLFNHFKLDIEEVQDNHTLLDLALANNNFNLFIKLLDMGAGRKANSSLFSQFCKNLSNEKKILKPYLSRLFLINPKINWEVSLNQLFPLLDSDNNTKNVSKIIYSGTNSTKRIISNEIYNQLFDELTGKPKQSNKCGRGVVILVKDDFGNGIYIKLKPQSPGTEIAINYLYKQLFNSNLTPYCELVSINNIPVLLIQQIPGEPLIDIIEREGEGILDKIDKSNISKQLIMAMLTNNGDGDLGNFILVHNYFNDSYLLYSIDNDQCFVTSDNSKSLDNVKKPLQVETVLFFFTQINDPVHQDVINRIKNLDYYGLLKSWLLNLQYYHQLSSNYFKSTQEQLKKDIGVSFSESTVNKLFQKMKLLKHLFSKDKLYTHFQILESIEPLVYNRYKSIIYTQNLSILKKFSKLKGMEYHNELVTLSTPSTPQILNSNDMDQLWSGKFGPAQALKQLDSLNNQILNIKELLNKLYQLIPEDQKFIISDYDLEQLLKREGLNNIEGSNLEVLLNYIKLKEISIINLKNIDLGIIEKFNLDFIAKLKLSDCDRIINFEGLNSRKLCFKSLIKLKLNNFSQLTSIRVESPNFQIITIKNCKLLNVLEIETLNEFSCNLISTLSNQNIQVLNYYLYYNSKIENLNISKSDFGEEVTINNVSLKGLVISKVNSLRKINLEVPVIESFSIEGCKSLTEISTVRNDQNINNNLWNILMSKDINYFKANNISINMAAAKQIYNLNKLKDFIMLVPNDSAFLIPHNTTCRFYYKVPTNFTFKSRIPKNILSLSISGDLPQQLYEEKLPNSIKYLQLYDTKMVNTNDLKLEYLFLGYGIKNQINIGFDIELATASNNNNKVLNPLYYLTPDKVIKEYNFQIESDNLVNYIYYYRSPRFSLLSSPHSQDIINSGIIFDLCSVPKHLVIYNFNNGYIFNDNSDREFRFVLLKDFDKEDTILNSNNSVYLDLKLLYEIFSISSLKPPVNLLQCLNGYNQPIISGTIPSTITSLYLREVNYPLSIGSIPTSVTHLELCDGFNQEITKEGIIPNSVRYLFIGNIKYSLNKNSIPKELEILEFGINFKFDSLYTGVIPNTLQQLIIFEYNYFNIKIKPKLSLSQNIKILNKK